MTKTLSSLSIGALSGTLLYLMALIFFRNDMVGILTLGLVGLVGGVLTAYGVTRYAKTVPQMWVVGSVVGAVEWMLLAVVITDASLRIAQLSQGGTGTGPTVFEQTLVSAKIYTLGGTGIAVLMGLFCLVVSLVANKVDRPLEAHPT